MTVRVRLVKDRTAALRKRLEPVTVRVGILGSKAEERHKDEAGEPTPITVAELAVIHEFGTATIPARSFIRAPVDRLRPVAMTMIRRLAERVRRGEMTQEQAAEWLGSWAAGVLSDGVRKGLPVEPLAEATKRRRRGKVAIPLFDTGQLASAITWEVSR